MDDEERNLRLRSIFNITFYLILVTGILVFGYISSMENSIHKRTMEEISNNICLDEYRNERYYGVPNKKQNEDEEIQYVWIKNVSVKGVEYK